MSFTNLRTVNSEAGDEAVMGGVPHCHRGRTAMGEGQREGVVIGGRETVAAELSLVEWTVVSTNGQVE